MSCPSCGGVMSTPFLSRRSGWWCSTCRACGYFQRTAAPTGPVTPTADHGAMFAREAGPARLVESGGFSVFDRAATAATARHAILRRAQAARDGKTRQVGSE